MSDAKYPQKLKVALIQTNPKVGFTSNAAVSALNLLCYCFECFHFWPCDLSKIG